MQKPGPLPGFLPWILDKCWWEKEKKKGGGNKKILTIKEFGSPTDTLSQAEITLLWVREESWGQGPPLILSPSPLTPTLSSRVRAAEAAPRTLLTPEHQRGGGCVWGLTLRRPTNGSQPPSSAPAPWLLPAGSPGQPRPEPSSTNCGAGTPRSVLRLMATRCYKGSSKEVGEPSPYYTVKSERERQISSANTYIWKLERWCRRLCRAAKETRT